MHAEPKNAVNSRMFVLAEPKTAVNSRIFVHAEPKNAALFIKKKP